MNISLNNTTSSNATSSYAIKVTTLPDNNTKNKIFEKKITKIENPISTKEIKNENMFKTFDKEITEENELKKQIVDDYSSYRSEYERIFSKGQGLIGNDDLSMIDMYESAMKEFNKIEESSDDAETKAIKYSSLEDALHFATEMITYANVWMHVKVDDLNIEQNVKINHEMNRFAYDQNRAITNSVKKLTNNFFDYMKDNKYTTEFNEVLNYMNKDSGNKDINNLSLSELEGYFDYKKEESFMITHSTATLDYYSGYFNMVAEDKWKKEIDIFI